MISLRAAVKMHKQLSFVILNDSSIKSEILSGFLLEFQLPPPRLELPPEESTDLEELEQFAKMFKQKRIKLGK